VRVKVCGITNADDLQLAVAAGTNAVGFVVGFPHSPRNLRLDEAQRLMQQVPPFVVAVAVVPMADPVLIREVVRQCRPNLLQLHGGPPLASPPALSSPPGLMRVLSAKNADVMHHALQVHRKFGAVLLDSHVGESIGGTGEIHDWRLSARIREQIAPTPLVLAGGLNPSNVQQAIRTVRPYAVDVSSGVEVAPGRKDPARVRELIRQVHAVTV
jgi:phosphoribosylanthranilate isomerase